MAGMTAVNTWNVSILKERTNMTVKEYRKVLAADMIKVAKKFKKSSRPSPTLISIATNIKDTDTTSISLLSDFSRVIEYERKIQSHTKVILDKSRQVRCIWCSRVHLLEQKTTMRCIECNRAGFCRDQGRDC